MKLTEAQIEQAVCQWLHYNNFFVVKFKDQTAHRDGKYHKPLPFQTNGVSDLMAIRDGNVYWIEVKSKTGTQSKAQKEFQLNIELNGGTYWLVRSIDEVKALLG